MSFTSLVFYLALVPVAIAYYALKGRQRSVFLLLISYAFYAYFSVPYLILLILASALAYGVGIAMARTDDERYKLALLWLGAGSLVAMIVLFKAGGAISGWILPLGISYYSFKLIGYLIEVYWDEEAVERDPVLFFLFPAFFPQIVSGPIQRADAFFEQMREVSARKADYEQINTGFGYILGGLMLKLLIGDRLSGFISVVDTAHGAYSYWVVLTAVCCYTLQLFADFAGYSNIAIGIGKVFGIDAPPNFAAPFRATNIQDMWRRWHMSLTSWVTDYLFTPLSMALRNLGRAGLILCIVLNMVIIGLWHGLTINFLIFGMLHALFVSVTALVLANRKKGAAKNVSKTPAQNFVAGALAVVGATTTFALMTFSQIFWHSGSWEQAISIVQQLVGATPSGAMKMVDVRVDVSDPVYICMAISYYVGLGLPGAERLLRSADSITPKWLQYGAGLFVLSVLSIEAGGKFIYGQF